MKRDDLYTKVLLDIVCGRHPPGARLDESAVANFYSAGRAAVRDVLLRLDLEGFVRRRPRVGTTVADLTILELQQVFEARVVIEVQCAVLAAQLANAEEIAAIQTAFDGFESVVDARDFRALVTMDQEFHQAVARGTHNRYLLSAVSTLHNSTLRYWYFALQRRTGERVRAAIGQHLRASAAIASHDSAAAEREMRRLVGGFQEAVKSMIGGSPSPEDAASIP
jgi:GntR family transcriptional regulator, rspAB operon transcriptional repressor